MDDLARPTFWPLPPTGIGAASLLQQLQVHRRDLAALAESTQSAADRIASVLQYVRSQDESNMNTSAESESRGSELSATVQDHPFAQSGSFNNARSPISSTVRTFPGIKDKDSCHHQRDGWHTNQQQIPESFATTRNQGSSRPLHEQLRTFFAVAASLKDEANRARQCEIVEVSSMGTAHLRLLSTQLKHRPLILVTSSIWGIVVRRGALAFSLITSALRHPSLPVI